MDAFLKRGKQEAKAAAVPTLSDTLATPLLSEDPRVATFYAQLSPREQIAHKIAVEKLGTSYDVTRTHGFLKWLKKQG
jgi:hypothetical protein